MCCLCVIIIKELIKVRNGNVLMVPGLSITELFHSAVGMSSNADVILCFCVGGTHSNVLLHQHGKHRPGTPPRYYNYNCKLIFFVQLSVLCPSIPVVLDYMKKCSSGKWLLIFCVLRVQWKAVLCNKGTLVEIQLLISSLPNHMQSSPHWCQRWDIRWRHNTRNWGTHRMLPCHGGFPALKVQMQ